MSQLREPRHPFMRQMRQPFLTDSERVRMEKREKEEKIKKQIIKEEKRISGRILLTIGGVAAALVALGHGLEKVFTNEQPTCPAPKKFAVAKPPPAVKQEALPKCGMTEQDELRELRKATKDMERLREYLKEAEKEIKDVSNYKRSTFVDRVKAATKGKS